MLTTCAVCKNPIDIVKKMRKSLGYEVMCDKCGFYTIQVKLDAILLNEDFPRHTIASWIFEQNRMDIYPSLLMKDYTWIKSLPDKHIKIKYERFLSFLNRNEAYNFKAGCVEILRMTWCKDLSELSLLINKALRERHIFEDISDNGVQMYKLTFEGRELADDFGTDNTSTKVFMAFHFTDDMKQQFESTIRRAVTDASENRLEAVRVSSSNTDHDTKIDDELIAMLKSSKAVIADFTGQRNAVYYEAGYAMGLGIPVIWTCKETDSDALSFDTRQYPHIIWKDEDDLYTQVFNRLKAKIL